MEKKTHKTSKFNFKDIFGYKWNEILQGERLSFVISLILLAICIYILLSLSSYILNGEDDQAFILKNITDQHYHNFGGKWGAYLSHYLLNQYFGIGSFFIPIFFLGVSIKLMHTYHIRLWKWFINCSYLMVWLSILLTAFSSKEFFNIFPESWLKIPIENGWGGSHGHYICYNITRNLGIIGLVLTCVLSTILYIIFLWKETISWFKFLSTPTQWFKNFNFNPFKHSRASSSSTVETIQEEKDSAAADLSKPSFESEVPPVQNESTDDDTASISSSDTENESEENTSTSIELELPVYNDTSTSASPSNTEVENTTENSETPSPLEIDEVKEEELAEKNVVATPLEEMGPYDPHKDLEHYQFPELSLLKHYDDIKPSIDMEEQNENTNRIVKVLHDFGVEIVNIKATIGPAVTLYEVTPAPGVRINRIRNLGDDIALSLSAIGIRIIAPIPGRGTIGIEVPNKNPKLVSMESILNSKKFQECDYELPLAIGKTITNEVFIVDLAKMPHILVAGATGQGKSVGLNAMIASLLYKKHPAELKIVMVDPKKVEFSIYSPLEKHFLAKIPSNEEPIITDVNKVVQTLKSLCAVMDHRYDLLKKAHVRHIKEYNAKFIQRKLNPNDGHEYMPYIVIIIDEFGDLIMTAGKEVELPIARIAQLARAVGMHMVIATQRPTTNIITGTIKANFPARMAFKVTSPIDSRTILERTGANQLIGRGDLLFLAGTEPIRVQCAFLNTQEVENINKFIAGQQSYLTAFELPEVQDEDEDAEGGSGNGPLDTLFADVARYIILNQAGSTSLIQRKFAIGYNRAGRIMDQLEHHGIVGPARGSKPREVLVSDESIIESIINP